MKKTVKEESWKEGYDSGWDNGFKACLIHLRETLIDELVKRNRLANKLDEPIIEKRGV